MFPARAGMNRRQFVYPLLSTYVPRTGGDEPGYSLLQPSYMACSPHGRG